MAMHFYVTPLSYRNYTDSLNGIHGASISSHAVHPMQYLTLHVSYTLIDKYPT